MKFNYTITYPTTLDTLTNPTSGNGLNSPDHATQHADANDAIEALEAKVGVNSSAVTTSHDYKLSGVTGSDKAVSKTGTETLTNKTLTSPQINFGTNATGDIIYRDGSGVTSRLAIGSASQILQVSAGGIPEWIANPSASAASDTAAGIVELATTAETTTGTDATRAVTPDGLHDMTSLSGAAWFLDEDTMSSDSAVKTASQQSIKAYVDTTRSGTNGSTTRDLSTASGNQTIAHGLGRTPKKIKITVMYRNGSTGISQSFGVYNGTTNSSIYIGANSNNQFYSGADSTNIVNIYATDITTTTPQTATATFDSTNITLAWTKVGSPTITVYIMWEAE